MNINKSVQETGKLATSTVTPILEDSLRRIESGLSANEEQRRAFEVKHVDVLKRLNTESNQKMEALWTTSHERQLTSAQSLRDSLEATVSQINDSLTASSDGVFQGLEALSMKITEEQARADAERLETWSRSLAERSEEQKDELTSITVMLSEQLRELSSVQQTHNSALHAGLAELTGQWKAELEGLQGETIEGQRRLVTEFQTALETLHRQAAEAEGGRWRPSKSYFRSPKSSYGFASIPKLGGPKSTGLNSKRLPKQFRGSSLNFVMKSQGVRSRP